jgi:hypothetical protein
MKSAASSNIDFCTGHTLGCKRGMIDPILDVGEGCLDGIDSQLNSDKAQILGHYAPSGRAFLPFLMHQFQTDVKPDEMEVAAPKGDQETNKGIEDEAQVGGKTLAHHDYPAIK